MSIEVCNLLRAGFGWRRRTLRMVWRMSKGRYRIELLLRRPSEEAE